jgi:adenylate cyclase
MGVEIERKFLVISNAWRDHASVGQRIRQGYLARDGNTVRVRRTEDRAVLTVKGPRSGLSRREHEYEIPLAEADELLAHLCLWPLIDKTRFEVVVADHVWEVDVYDGVHDSLVLAEIELDAEGEHFVRPIWLGAEVSGDPRYGFQGLSRAGSQGNASDVEVRSFAPAPLR